MQTFVHSEPVDLVEVSCPACGMWGYEAVLTRNGYRIVRCESCSCLFVNPRPREPYLVAIYRRFPQLANGREGQVGDDPSDGQREAYYRLRVLMKHVEAGRLLDLGCGRGDFLSVAGRIFDVVGVDIVPRLRPSLESVPVFEGRLEDAHFERQSFDVVSAVEVFEHLFDPRRTLAEIRRILKPEGWLLLQTGDADGLPPRLNVEKWTYVQPPIHLNLFSRKALGRLLGDTGFRVVARWSFGRAPTKVPFIARFPAGESFRPLLDFAARRGLLGCMILASKKGAG